MKMLILIALAMVACAGSKPTPTPPAWWACDGLTDGVPWDAECPQKSDEKKEVQR